MHQTHGTQSTADMNNAVFAPGLHGCKTEYECPSTHTHAEGADYNSNGTGQPQVVPR